MQLNGIGLEVCGLPRENKLAHTHMGCSTGKTRILRTEGISITLQIERGQTRPAICKIHGSSYISHLPCFLPDPEACLGQERGTRLSMKAKWEPYVRDQVRDLTLRFTDRLGERLLEQACSPCHIMATSENACVHGERAIYFTRHQYVILPNK